MALIWCISNFSDNSKYSTSPVHTYSNSTSFYALKCFIYIASTPTANWESPNNLTAQTVGGGRGKACRQKTSLRICLLWGNSGNPVPPRTSNFDSDVIWDEFVQRLYIFFLFFLNNKKKRKLIGLSNCQILHKNLCFPLHKTTLKKKWNSLPDVSHRPLRSPRCGLHAGQATLLYKFQLIWQQKSFPLSHSPFWNSFGACGFGICGLHGRLYSQWFLEVLLRPYTDFQPCPLPAAISPDSLIL